MIVVVDRSLLRRFVSLRPYPVSPFLVPCDKPISRQLIQILRDAQLLEPVVLEYSEDFWIRPEQLAKLEPDKDIVDVYFFQGTLLNFPATIIAEIFKKPVVMRAGMNARDAAAYLKASLASADDRSCPRRAGPRCQLLEPHSTWRAR